MTIRQSVLKAFYPLIMQAGKWVGGKTGIEINEQYVKPVETFYGLNAKANNDDVIEFAGFRGKKIIIVNIASDCGYTGQLSELQQLHELYKDRLAIIGFPANDFKQQEKGSDTEIASFCKLNYGVDFTLMKKTIVIPDELQNPVYKWLTDKRKNGWNDKAPEWNFSKYLVNEEGILTHYFSPTVSPLGKDVINNL